MTRRLSAPLAIVAAALLLAGALLVGSRGIAARDATPVPPTGHPAHIHAGSCETLGEVVFPLNDVGGTETMATPVAGSTPVAAPLASPAASSVAVVIAGSDDLSSTTTVEADLATILGAEHAINVHESAENIERYIACGDVRGNADAGTVSFLLRELNDSGYMGVATLTDNGDGTTTVVLSLWESGS